jgi:ABC-type branched-subunit amino acid transport system substrate-binding protein
VPTTAAKRLYANYFRTCTTDAVQGPFAAQYLFECRGIKSVATIHDKKTYGQGLVEAFTAEFTKGGGTDRHRRDDQRADDTSKDSLGHQQDQAVALPGDLLRRRVPAGRSASRSR